MYSLVQFRQELDVHRDAMFSQLRQYKVSTVRFSVVHSIILDFIWVGWRPATCRAVRVRKDIPVSVSFSRNH